jgi:D-amino-acid oxidase
MTQQIAIIGGGISGLSTAFTLLRAGYAVTVIAEDFSTHIVSFKAAAFWFPYHVRNDKRGVDWCQKSYHIFNALSANAATGISMVKLMKVAKADVVNDDSWLSFMPENSYRVLAGNEIPKGYAFGHEAIVPLIETQIFLPWLLQQVQLLGATIIEQTITDITTLQNEFDMVVNCTGLGAATLCNDDSVIPVRGQIVLTEPGIPNNIFLDNQSSIYIVPRKDATIIGGTYEENIGEAITVTETLLELHQKAVAVLPTLQHQQIIGNWAGLRPYRKEVRLERVANIIHNYGHGGSGYTLSFGCAENVLALLQQT